jgi:hypothetical protein
LVSSNLSYSISLLGHSECLYHFTIRMRYLLQELPTCPVHLTLQSFVYGVHVVLVTTTDFMLKNREYYIIMYNFRFTSYLYFFLSVFDFFFRLPSFVLSIEAFIRIPMGTVSTQLKHQHISLLIIKILPDMVRDYF